jgi:hypothetical protein
VAGCACHHDAYAMGNGGNSLGGTLECDAGLVEEFEQIDDALDLNDPKACIFEPRTMQS